jgi:cyclophilin family peptidyl-prolyl cis-trans isomerase/HEAT repeat protein
MRAARAKTLLALAAFTASACANSRKAASNAALSSALWEAEDHRDARAEALGRGLKSSDPELRSAALRAIARIEDPGAAALAAPLIADSDPNVAAWAAFAVGQAGEPAEGALVAALSGTSPAMDRVALALGRAASATAARSLAALFFDARPKVRAAALLASGVAKKRLGARLTSVPFLGGLVDAGADPDRDVRYGAIYALMRFAGPSLAPAATGALVRALGDTDPEIRANAARGLSAASVGAGALDSALADPDWRVRVEVARALGELGRRSAAEAAVAKPRLAQLFQKELERLRRGDPLRTGLATHVLQAAIESAAKLDKVGRSLIEDLAAELAQGERFAPDAAPDRARLGCATAFELDLANRTVDRVRNCGDASLPAWRRWQFEARLLGRLGPEQLDTLRRFTLHEDPRVRVAAVEAIGEISGERAVQALTELLGSSEPYLASAAAEGLGHQLTQGYRPTTLVEDLRRALRNTVTVRDPSLAVSVLDTIAALRTEAAPLLSELDTLVKDPRPAIRRRVAVARAALAARPLEPYGAHPPEAALPTPSNARTVLRLSTPRGAVTLEIFGELAPRAAGTVVSLAGSGFYAGKTFHRVVSDFVVQGGCPRGDGYGGPGYAILDEPSLLPFVRGALGVATSGRDTGGSQLFVMHSYQPHLDGAYTLLGRVVEGMEAVDALQPDDRILEVVVGDSRSGRSQVR